MSNNIFLVGPMGAGKSTIGKMLADRTGRKFIDADNVMVEKTGVEIDLIFEIEGESGFRKRECKLIEELTALDDIVLATGGGAVLSSENRNFLKQRGTVVYLQASAEQLFERTVKDKKRPLLQTRDRLGKIKEILTVREPLYKEIADEIIATDGKNVKQIVDALCRTQSNN
ncbi:MAG: Shikimate kinase I [Gammaproteobacteria bacterium]|nr:Shikimate kinase I [Gammaproteobacteria bacterium]